MPMRADLVFEVVAFLCLLACPYLAQGDTATLSVLGCLDSRVPALGNDTRLSVVAAAAPFTMPLTMPRTFVAATSNRRVFIQRIFLVATAPVVVAFLPLADAVPVSSSRNSLPIQEPDDVTDKDLVLFRIYGWDELDAEGPSGNGLSIRINQSWRTAWR